MSGSSSPAEISLMITLPYLWIARAATLERNVSIETGRSDESEPHGPDTQIDAPPLLLGRHLVGTRARRITAHVDHRSARLDGFAHTAFDIEPVRRAAAGEKRVGSDVDLMVIT